MLLIPAIDLKDGKCVRLRQGLMEDVTVFSDNPVDTAKRWVDAGTKRLHLVDLNGAFAGEPVNGDVVSDILSKVSVPCQLGGGIRDMATIDDHGEAVRRELGDQVWSVSQPAFEEKLAAMQRKISGKS